MVGEDYCSVLLWLFGGWLEKGGYQCGGESETDSVTRSLVILAHITDMGSERTAVFDWWKYESSITLYYEEMSRPYTLVNLRLLVVLKNERISEHFQVLTWQQWQGIKLLRFRGSSYPFFSYFTTGVLNLLITRSEAIMIWKVELARQPGGVSWVDPHGWVVLIFFFLFFLVEYRVKWTVNR